MVHIIPSKEDMAISGRKINKDLARGVNIMKMKTAKKIYFILSGVAGILLRKDTASIAEERLVYDFWDVTFLSNSGADQ